jgi:hypothetical protein
MPITPFRAILSQAGHGPPQDGGAAIPIDYQEGEKKFGPIREAHKKRLDELSASFKQKGYLSPEEEMEWDKHHAGYTKLEQVRKHFEGIHNARHRRQQGAMAKQGVQEDVEGAARAYGEGYGDVAGPQE